MNAETTPTEIVMRTARQEALDYRKVFDAETLRIIKANKCPGATDEQFGALMTIAVMKGLNPMTNQVHFVDRAKKGEPPNYVVQVGIDGFRLQAVRTGDYDGQDEPVIITDKENPSLIVCAKVAVYRKGISRPFWGVAYYDEYVQTFWDKGSKVPNSMWRERPYLMLTKCAEALGLRKAFPEELGDLYTEEEIGHGNDEPRESTGQRLTRQLAGNVVGNLDGPQPGGIGLALGPARVVAGAGQIYEDALVQTGAKPAQQPAAQPEKTAPPAIDYDLLLDAANTLADMDALGARANEDKSFTGPRRQALLKKFNAKYKAMREAAAPPAPPKCKECGLEGTHAQSCDRWEPPVSPDEPAKDGAK